MDEFEITKRDNDKFFKMLALIKGNKPLEDFLTSEKKERFLKKLEERYARNK